MVHAIFYVTLDFVIFVNYPIRHQTQSNVFGISFRDFVNAEFWSLNIEYYIIHICSYFYPSRPRKKILLVKSNLSSVFCSCNRNKYILKNVRCSKFDKKTNCWMKCQRHKKCASNILSIHIWKRKRKKTDNWAFTYVIDDFLF